MEQAPKTNWHSFIELGILIPLLTILSIGAVYYYEWGYLEFYNIPKDIIEIELTKNIYLIFPSIVLVLILTHNIITVKKIIEARQRIKLKAQQRIKLIALLPAILVLLFSLYFAFYKMLIDIDKISTYFIIALFIWYFTFILKDSNENIWQKLNFYYDNKISFIGAFLASTILTFILYYFLGYLSAKPLTLVMTKADHKTVLIRKYSDCIIYGIPDSPYEHLSAFIISRGKNDADTILISKY